MIRTTKVGTMAGLALAAAVAAGWAADAWRRGERLRTTHRILVDLLLNALTADDAATARHSRRVADLSFALALAAGVPARARTDLRVAALLHDLGKMDDRFWDILHSRGTLTAEQRAEMEEHPDESARILRPLEAIHPGLQAIVASHHESWDGSGYPAGLEGTRIPLGARIIAIADVFDALTQPREYREPMSPEDAFEEIRSLAGRKFDPLLVSRLDDPALAGRWMEIAREGLAEERSAHGQPEMAQGRA